MFVSIERRKSISRQVNYALYGKDEDGNVIEESTPKEDRHGDVVGSQGFPYSVTDDESTNAAVRDMEATSRMWEDLPPNPTGGRRPGQTNKPGFEMIFSWRDGDNPTDEHMAATARDALRHMDMDKAQAVYFRHRTTKYHHMHVVGSRTNPHDGYLFSATYEMDNGPRLMKWRRQYEAVHENGMAQHLPNVAASEDARDMSITDIKTEKMDLSRQEAMDLDMLSTAANQKPMQEKVKQQQQQPMAPPTHSVKHAMEMGS